MSEIELIAVDDIVYRFRPQPWAFARDEAAAIDANWAEITADNSGLFDGQVLISTGWDIVMRNGLTWLEATCMPCRYRAFMAWRHFGFPDRGVWNLFAMAALETRDGAFILGHMATNTANPGRVYFPAGTPDLDDLRGEEVDLRGSVTRELAEETGITDVTLSEGWTIVVDGPRVACMKRARSPSTATDLLRGFEAFQAAQQVPELQGLEAVVPTGDLADVRMPPFMLRYLQSLA